MRQAQHLQPRRTHNNPTQRLAFAAPPAAPAHGSPCDVYAMKKGSSNMIRNIKIDTQLEQERGSA